MTYCIGATLDKGMIFVSDSRTNAGIDNIAKRAREPELRNRSPVRDPLEAIWTDVHGMGPRASNL